MSIINQKLSVKQMVLVAIAGLIAIFVFIGIVGSSDYKPTTTQTQTAKSNLKHDKAYVIATLGAIGGLAQVNFEIVQTWNEETGIYANIAVSPETSRTDLIALLRAMQEGLKDEKWVELSVFDSVAVADNYFQKITALHTAGKFTEADQLFSHYIGTYSKNTATGFEEIKVKEGDNWKKIR
jgi:hypothetical protein